MKILKRWKKDFIGLGALVFGLILASSSGNQDSNESLLIVQQPNAIDLVFLDILQIPTPSPATHDTQVLHDPMETPAVAPNYIPKSQKIKKITLWKKLQQLTNKEI